MRKREILIICLSSIIIFLLLASVVGYFAYWRFDHTETPDQLREPRIILGHGLLNKDLFIRVEDLGMISSIVYRKYDPDPNIELTVVGQTGAVFLDKHRNRKKTISFANQVESFLGFKSVGTNLRFGKIQVLDVDGDRVCEFLVRNNLNKAELISSKGEIIWEYGEGDGTASFLMDMNAGDVDGDNKIEYGLAYLNGKGLVLLNQSLKPIWSKPDVHAKVIEFVDIDGSGQLKIAHDDFTRIVLRDGTGNIISENETGYYIGHFSIIRWPSKKDSQHALHFSDGVIRLFDFSGNTIREFVAPLSGELHRLTGVAVKLKSDEPEYFAAVASHSVFERSILYIFNVAGNLIYQEVLPKAYGSIETFPLDKMGNESILLGGDGEVLQYKMENGSSNK